MQHYPDRPAAVKAALAMGWTMFDTVYTPGKGHAPVSTGGPIAEWARVWAEDYMIDPYRPNAKAFVKHVGHRDRKPLIRITCPVSELAPEQVPPEAFIVEPYCESMLSNDVHTTRREPREAGEKPVGGNARFDPTLRARSTFTGSPVAFVHGMCDDMHKEGKFDRKVAVQRAIDAGVTPNTANAQVYRWRKNNAM